jgi:hypothetical protein
MEHCGIGGFNSAAEVAGMAGFMTAVSLVIVLLFIAALVWAGRSLYELSMGSVGTGRANLLWLLLALIGMLAFASLGAMAIPDTACLWGAV